MEHGLPLRCVSSAYAYVVVHVCGFIEVLDLR